MVGRRRKAGRRHAAARNFCEDFAPQNEAARLCGERGANRVPKNSGRITSTAANEFKNSLFCRFFRSLFLHNLRQRLSLKLFEKDFLDSAKFLVESARGIL